MQANATERGDSQLAIEAAILAELRSTPLAAADLKARVKRKVPGLKDKQFKPYLDALAAEERIHGRPKVGKNGKPTKTIEAYAYGAAPPPPPPPPPPRERAPKEILAILEAGPLSAAELKKRVNQRVPGLAVKDYNLVLLKLADEHQIYGRRKLSESGKPSKTIESFALGGPPAEEFVAPVLAQWKVQRDAARLAGVGGEALVAALLEGLKREGVEVGPSESAEPTSDDREKILRGVQQLVAREGQGALIPIRKLRSALQLPKQRFDAAVLDLYANDTIILHHHDYVGSLSDAERDELVVDRHNNYYIGVALRGAQ